MCVLCVYVVCEWLSLLNLSLVGLLCCVARKLSMVLLRRIMLNFFFSRVMRYGLLFSRQLFCRLQPVSVDLTSGSFLMSVCRSVAVRARQ